MNDGKNKAQFQRAFPASCKSTFYPDSYRWFRLAPRFVRPVRDGRRHINPEAAVSVSFFFFFLSFFRYQRKTIEDYLTSIGTQNQGLGLFKRVPDLRYPNSHHSRWILDTVLVGVHLRADGELLSHRQRGAAASASLVGYKLLSAIQYVAGFQEEKQISWRCRLLRECSSSIICCDLYRDAVFVLCISGEVPPFSKKRFGMTGTPALAPSSGLSTRSSFMCK